MTWEGNLFVERCPVRSPIRIYVSNYDYDYNYCRFVLFWMDYVYNCCKIIVICSSSIFTKIDFVFDVSLTIVRYHYGLVKQPSLINLTYPIMKFDNIIN